MDAVLNWIWQGCVVAIAAAGVLRLMESWRAAIRYRAVWLALGCILLLPIVPLLWAVLSPGPDAASGVPLRDPVVAIPAGWWTSGAVIVVLWGAWSAIFGARIAAAAAALRRARQECQAIPAGFEARLRRWPHIRLSGRQARVVVSGGVRAAAVLGGRPPIIALSPVLLDHLSDDELDRVVIHEWAHIQRRDDVAHAVQLVVRLLAGWHPAVWWCDRQLRIEREIACDEMALTLTGSIKEYAACLTKLASLPRSSLRPLPVVSMLSSGLRGRIVRILSFDRVVRARRSASAATVAGISLGLTAMVVGGFPAIGTASARAVARTIAAEDAGSQPSGSGVVPAPTARPVLVAAAQAGTPAQAPPARVPGERRATDGQTPAAPGQVPSADAQASPASPDQPVGPLAFGTVAVPSPAELTMPIADAQASQGQVAEAPAPGDVAQVRPWTAAADTGVAIGRGSQNAAVATAGFFNRLGRKIGNSF